MQPGQAVADRWEQHNPSFPAGLSPCSEAGDTSELIYRSCQAEGRLKVTCFLDVSVLIRADLPAQKGEENQGSRSRLTESRSLLP